MTLAQIWLLASGAILIAFVVGVTAIESNLRGWLRGYDDGYNAGRNCTSKTHR